MYSIYFDENAGDEKGRFDLGIPGSLRDIAPIAGQVRDGLHVMLYDNEALEVEAVLEFEPAYQRWMARPLWDSVKHTQPDHALA
jgi:hypothetical protein